MKKTERLVFCSGFPFILIIIISFLLISAGASYARTLNIALTYSDEHCAYIEKRINRELAGVISEAGYEKISVISSFGYDYKLKKISNNEVDIIEGGYGIFYKANRIDEFNVILQACYYNDYEDMFYISGVIIANREDKLKVRDLKNAKIFAVSPHSSSGYLLQKIYLENKRIEVQETGVEFVGDHRLVAEKVINNPGSAGFAGSFVEIDEEKLVTIAETEKAPANVVMARRGISGELLSGIARELKTYSLEEPLIVKNRFFVFPPEDDYRHYLKLYKSRWEYLREIAYKILAAVATGVIIILSFLYFKAKKELKAQKYENIIKKYGYQEDISQIEDGFGANHKYSKDLKEAIRLYDEEQYLNSIILLAGFIEGIVIKIAVLLQEKLNISTSKKIEDRDSKNIVDFITRHIGEVLRAKAAKTAQTGVSESDVISLTDEEKEILDLLPTDGLIRFLYVYRNLSSHKETPVYRDFFGKEDADLVIRNYIFLMKKLIRVKMKVPGFLRS